ncbi:MAG: TauD/TfdA family dioxygenase [Rhodospirillales bacterium]
MTRNHPINVQPLTGAIGARVTGVDLSQELDAETFAAIRQALNEYLVLAFSDQDLTPAEQSRFSKLFGPAEPHPYGARVGVNNENPEVIVLETKPGRRGARNDFWHSDISASEKPPALSLLHARIVPEGRGDTLFCNMYRAFETLSPAMQQTLRGLDALHSPDAIRQRNLAEPDTDSPQIPAGLKSFRHPAVRTHPETGRDALYVNTFFTVQFADMTVEESRPILDFLMDHATRPENVYRHRWQAGDFVMWDNRATMHYAVRDYDETMPRRMHRTTAGGDRPFLNRPASAA